MSKATTDFLIDETYTTLSLIGDRDATSGTTGTLIVKGGIGADGPCYIANDLTVTGTFTSPGTNATLIGGHTVAVTSTVEHDVLVFDGSDWVSDEVKIDGIGVVADTPTTDDILSYNGTNWVNQRNGFLVLQPQGNNIPGEDRSPLNLYALAQETIGLPIFLYDSNADTTEPPPSTSEFRLESLASSDTAYNHFEWVGINNPTLRFLNDTLISAGIKGCRIRVMGANDFTLQARDVDGIPRTSIFDITEILNDPTTSASGDPASRSFTFDGGYHRVGYHRTTQVAFDLNLINKAHVIIGTLERAQNIKIGNGCHLEVMNVSKVTQNMVFKVGLNASDIPSSNAHLVIHGRENALDTIQVELHGSDCTFNGNSINPIVVKGTSNGASVVGTGNIVQIEADALNANIVGLQANVLNSGTGSFYHHRPDPVTAQFSDFSDGGEVAVNFNRHGNAIIAQISEITGTSNGSSFSATEIIPSDFRPTANTVLPAVIVDNGFEAFGTVTFATTGNISLTNGVSSSFSNSGVKGLKEFSGSWIKY